MARIVTLIGGSGFLGEYIAKELLKKGYLVRIASRNPDNAIVVKTAGLGVGQVGVMQCNVRFPETVERAVKDSWAVINLVGILCEKGKQNFADVQALGAETVAKACANAGVERLIHISALGVDTATKSHYARTKLNGEKAVFASFPDATIIRPSVIFGAEDHFVNMFAGALRWLPMFPLFGGGKTKFQPVYVNDIAKAIPLILENPKYKQKIFELAGRDVLSLKQIIEFIRNYTRKFCLLIPVPFALGKLLALPMKLLPKPPITVDQLVLLQYDNVVESPSNLTFSTLGITPQKFETIVPKYLERLKQA
ncbi:MAG: complex I NDUFA9 subunit family protein [Proteobacteria bacterium]|nr:complex I NDUFA9 subunit family protein [Pseudomonadota bacterium]